MNVADLAIRAARAELERDQALAQVESLRESLVRALEGQPLTLFGQSPDYWLDVRRDNDRLRDALRQIASLQSVEQDSAGTIARAALTA